MPEEIILTESGVRKLQDELEHMKTVKRAEVAEALRKARGYGDLSENFEYHAARRDQGILNGRIAEIERTLELAVVVPDAEGDPDEVALGCAVKLFDTGADEEWEITLTDRAHADPLQDRVSIESPLGQALMGHRPGDEVPVTTADGVDTYRVLEIRRA